MNRRNYLAGLGSVATLGLSGCLGAAGMAKHEATPAGAEQSVREETGYELGSVEPQVVARSVEVGPYSEEVTVTNYVTQHNKTINLGPLGSQEAAAFVVLTSPQVSIVGRSFNPVADMSSDELVSLVAENYDGLSNPQRLDAGTVTVFDQETTKTRYEAQAEYQSRTVELFVHVTEAVQTEENHLVTVTVYPKQLDEQEADNVDALLGGITTDIEATPSDS